MAAAGGPWQFPSGPHPQGLSQMDDELENQVVLRLMDLLGPMLAARVPARACEDLREVPQWLREGAPEGPHEVTEELRGIRASVLPEKPLLHCTGAVPLEGTAKSYHMKEFMPKEIA
jgi:hypothetical protein